MSAPQSTQSTSLQHRLLSLVQTLQFAWFAGHVTLLICSLRYIISYATFHASSRWAGLSYRTAFLAAIVTYGIVVFKSFRARARAGKSSFAPSEIIGDENVQYLIMAFVWLMSHQVALAILPFTVYSVFHVATYTRSNLLPAISPASASAQANSATASTTSAGASATAASSSPAAKPKSGSDLANTIGHFVKTYYDTSMTLVAGLEIALWFRLFLPALLFKKGTWILLATYTIFFRARLSQSNFVQNAISRFGARIDAVLNKQDMPPAVRQAWATVKSGMSAAVQATDMNRYAGAAGAQGQQAPVKKAQ